MFPQFLLLLLGTLVSEDLTCITAGVLIAQGRIGFIEGTAGCLVGIALGDILLFLSGRLMGRAALNLRFVRRFISPRRVDEASRWLSERGMKAVIISRFTPGLRLATYFAAGSLRTRFWTFAAYFFAASILWTPLLVGSTVLFGDRFLRAFFASGSHTPVAFAAASGALTVNLVLSRRILMYSRWREWVGRLKRITRWEFWPPWLAYLPLIPYLFYLALRHRSLTLFTAANPAIPSGGFAGESKSDILAQLSRSSDAIARFGVIPGGLTVRARIDTALEAMEKLRLSFPIVLKPDVGERGSGVAIIRSSLEMERYLRQAPGVVILQQYIDGAEFGVFYYRYPHERRGRIFSITEKRFPEVIGDGRRSLWELILAHPRAVCIASAYARASKRPLSDVPLSGERVKLVELGSHCRGAIFLDGSRWNTPALENAVDRISQGYPGFYFGRFDVRTPSPEALARGVFTVLELNGVTAEATHVYDPAIRIFEAYRVMFEQWRVAFQIGAANRTRGTAPMPFREFVQLLAARFKR
jgi:membrane protein DedA with SNARE-associated domain